MEKDEVKSFLKQTEKIVKDLGSKAGDLLKAVEKDASYGTKAGMIKVEQLTLENEKNKLLCQLGRKAYELLKKDKVSHSSLAEITGKIKEIDNKLRAKKALLSNLKRKRKAGTASKNK